MKAITAAQQALLSCETVRAALCLKLTRAVDGFELGFTGHDKELIVDGLAYKPEQSLSPSAVESKADFSADAGDMVLLTSADVNERDLKGGRWDNSISDLFFVPDWADLTAGTVPLKRARLGRFEVERGRFRADLVGLGELVQQPAVDLTSLLCRRRLGDERCRVPLKPAVWLASTSYAAIEAGDRSVGSYVRPSVYSGLDAECTVAGTSGGTEPAWPALGGTVADGGATWRTYRAWTQQGTVTTAHERVHFVASGLAVLPDDWLKYGKLTWTGGANIDLSQDIRNHGAGGAVTLWDEMAEPIGVGDTFEAHAGCALRHDLDCRDKFDNIKNNGSEPFLPGADEATQFPDAR